MALDNLIALCRLEGGNNTEEALQLKEALQLTDDLPLRRLNYQCFKNGRSALHEAAARGNLPIVQALLEREVDTSLEDGGRLEVDSGRSQRGPLRPPLGPCFFMC